MSKALDHLTKLIQKKYAEKNEVKNLIRDEMVSF